MKSVLLFGAALLSLAACGPKAAPLVASATPQLSAKPGAPAPAAAPADCNVRVEKPWIDEETPLRRYTSEAATMGGACQSAVVTLVIRARDGSPIYTWSGRTQDIFGLNEAKDAAAMKTALLEWIDQTNTSLPTTDKLPDWETTDGQPKREEFPFAPEADYTRASWNALRKEKLDLFCFPQGMESLSCAALRDGEMELVGLQLFPG